MSVALRNPAESHEIQARVGWLWQRGYDTYDIARVINHGNGSWLVTEAEVAAALAAWRDKQARRL